MRITATLSGGRRVVILRTAKVKRIGEACELGLKVTVPSGTTRATVTISGKGAKRLVIVVRKA